ncbi:hypothetical protein PMAYCL1PPCAC_07884 [Pristionchus mayeri]|uniref:CX domain-containing protein n=1 Tax=Pristionchus mayeri TaxID=1317129 RepID=A0AAN4ZCZ8_9BILA|nr:hypothetical protein PMAYCL1PPCAC_07884 [Pristionchus mayeri]
MSELHPFIRQLSLLLFLYISSSGATVIHTHTKEGCKVDKHHVKSTSLRRSNESGATVHISSFRGGGSAQESDEPLVNSSVIYYSLFDQKSFTAVFKQQIEEKAAFERKINPHNFSLSTHQFMKIPQTVIDAKRPVTIGKSSLYYFWNVSGFSPDDNMNECFHYTTMNDDASVSFCNVSTMERCAANISDLPHFAPLTFFDKDGGRLTQFSWFCRAGQVCCAFECCDRYDLTIPAIVGSLAFLAIFILVLFCCCKIAVKKRNEWKSARARANAPVRFERVNSDPRLRESQML